MEIFFFGVCHCNTWKMETDKMDVDTAASTGATDKSSKKRFEVKKVQLYGIGINCASVECRCFVGMGHCR